MRNSKKYGRRYYMPPVKCMKWAEKEYVDHAPVWCSMDLRECDHVKAFPMSVEQKIDLFKLLVQIGLKEITVGSPASSESEAQFLHILLENEMIPDDVTIQLITPAEDESIRKTFDAVSRVKNVIVNVHNSISSWNIDGEEGIGREEAMQTAVEAARLMQSLAQNHNGKVTFEYSLENFAGTDPVYSLEACNAVLDVWKPDKDHKVIISLPATVECAMSHVYASQVEYMSENMKYRDCVILSLHPHNNRSCAVADAEMGLLAGADRIEGTLFGNGERTGNVDIVALSMNMYAQGVDSHLDFSDMAGICEEYEKYTGFKNEERNPYSDAGYILESRFGLTLPPQMREVLAEAVEEKAKELQRELQPEEIYSLFLRKFENTRKPYSVHEIHFRQAQDGIIARVNTSCSGIVTSTEAEGNGRLNAVSNALKRAYNFKYELVHFLSEALEQGDSANVIVYVGLQKADGSLVWGIGISVDLVRASIEALVAAINNQ